MIVNTIRAYYIKELILSLSLGSWERSIITHDAVIKGATDDEISNYDWTNYRRLDEVWPTSTGDDNALMIPRVSYNLLRRSPGKFRGEKRNVRKRKRDLLRSTVSIIKRFDEINVILRRPSPKTTSIGQVSHISVKLFDEFPSSCCCILCGEIFESKIGEFAIACERILRATDFPRHLIPTRSFSCSYHRLHTRAIFLLRYSSTIF